MPSCGAPYLSKPKNPQALNPVGMMYGRPEVETYCFHTQIATCTVYDEGFQACTPRVVPLGSGGTKEIIKELH